MKPEKKNVKHYYAKTTRNWQIRRFIRIVIILGLLFIGTMIYFYYKTH